MVAIVIGGILLSAFLANQWVIWRAGEQYQGVRPARPGALLVDSGITRVQMAGVASRRRS